MNLIAMSGYYLLTSQQ